MDRVAIPSFVQSQDPAGFRHIPGKKGARNSQEKMRRISSDPQGLMTSSPPRIELRSLFSEMRRNSDEFLLILKV
jgi:hypothetical protein